MPLLRECRREARVFLFVAMSAVFHAAIQPWQMRVYFEAARRDAAPALLFATRAKARPHNERCARYAECAANRLAVLHEIVAIRAFLPLMSSFTHHAPPFLSYSC